MSNNSNSVGIMGFFLVMENGNGISAFQVHVVYKELPVFQNETVESSTLFSFAHPCYEDEEIKGEVICKGEERISKFWKAGEQFALDDGLNDYGGGRESA